ncbi:TPA: hypothetical protein ACPVZF_003059 [Vibrio parahaemolyticus]
METQSNVSLQATLTPQKSQIVLFTFLILGAALCCVGFLFIYWKLSLWFVPTLIGTAMVIFAGFAWLKSQKDTDLSGCPTSITADADSTSVVVDSRFANSKDGVQFLTNFITVALNRKPLPAPDGLVDRLGEPIEGSYGQAQSQVDALNQEAQVVADNVARATGMPVCDDELHMTAGALPSDLDMSSSLSSNKTIE